MLAARREGRPRDGSHVHHVTGRQGRRPALPLQPRHELRRRHSPWPPHRRKQPASESPPYIRVGAHCFPAHIHQVGAGSTLKRVQPLVHSRYASPSRLPDPGRLAVPARPVVVRAASHPPQRLQGQAALSFTGLLRQPGEVGLSPAPGYMAPRGAPGRCGTRRCTASPWGSAWPRPRRCTPPHRRSRA